MSDFSRVVVLLILLATPFPVSASEIACDLLIVGGNESACAAAVQAARLGVPRIVLVNDIDWFGGQFSAEGVGCLDEWTTVRGQRVSFPRSGLFREIVDRIRAYNSRTYGVPAPGNAFCGEQTIEPAAAARIFEELLEPYVAQGVLRIERQAYPTAVELDDNRVAAVRFASSQPNRKPFTVRARLTIDASDWGDVIQLSGAKYGAGPDLKSRFGEASAPDVFDEAGALEMNPLTWCLVLREAGSEATIPRPATYDPRYFAAVDRTPPWVDSDMSAGIYSKSGWSIYTHRRLVDRWHFGFPVGTEATFLNWPVQDYPLCQLPQRVVDALEANEPGASRKNIVEMTPAQREIVFADVKQHALSFLYHLQTAVHDRVGDYPQSFRYMTLTDEFGTPDRLPPKPYVREGLRLEALYMLREQDIRADDREPGWARVMVPDAVFGFQFNIDFHPTRRKYLTDDRNGPWQFVHTANRGWHTDTDRSMFPLRGLVPVERDGLLGAGKNIGVSSVVQSSLRLHGQMMLVGQAAATVASLCLREDLPPRDVAAAPERWREVQQTLVRGCGGPGVLLWPWHDVPLDAPWFEAANLLPVCGVWTADPDHVFFEPDRTMTRRELARVLVRLLRASRQAPPWPEPGEPRYTDVPEADRDRTAIDAMIAWGQFGPQQPTFRPEGSCDHATLTRWLTALRLPTDGGLTSPELASQPLTRGAAVRILYGVLQRTGESLPTALCCQDDLADVDRDGIPDRDDPLPYDRDNDNVPDGLEP